MVGIIAFIENCVLLIGQPLFLGGFIRYFNKEPGLTEDYFGILFGFGIVFSTFFYLGTHHVFYRVIEHTGMKLRIASCSILYRKALRLSKTALCQTTVGQMVNLLSNDVSRFDTIAIHFHYLWIGPLQTIIVTAILWQMLGPSCLAGIVVLLLLVPLQVYVGLVFSRLRMETALKTDERIRIMDEIINSMRVIKMYAWEKPFTALIKEARKKEIDVIMKTSYFRAFKKSVQFVCNKIVIFMAFLVYVLTGNVLTAEKVFVASSLINTIRLGMMNIFPDAITSCSETYISCKRIQTFLELEENQHSNTDKTSVRPQSSSSLLHVILRELPVKQGSVMIQGKIAYVSQKSWLMSRTIRENILFGKPFEANKYYEVIRVCALERDLKNLPDGDQTMVGERGVALSGGQKARINLARAVYYDADIYLLDDPLSAVDAQVGKHLYEECISKFLSEKVRVLVTHQIQHIQTADQILILHNGCAQAQGTYEQLLEQGIDFAAMIGKRQRKNLKPNESYERLLANLVQKRKGELILSEEERSRFGRDDEHRYSVVSSNHHSVLRHLERNGFSKIYQKKYDILTLEENNNSVTVKTTLEQKSTGSVKLRTYGNYFMIGGGPLYFSAVIIVSIITQTLFTGSDYWLSIWTKEEQLASSSAQEDFFSNRTFERERDVYIYSGMTVALFLFSVVQTVMFFKLFLTASRRLHLKMFSAIIEAPIKFFDTHPNGQILNRFAKDLGQTDDILPQVLIDLIANVLTVFGIIVMVSIANVWSLLPTILLAVMFFVLRTIYLSTARDIKRLEGITRSPVFSHLSSSLQGLTTIRAFEAQAVFIKDFDDYQDLHSSAWTLRLCTSRCLAKWLDALTWIYLCVVTFSFFGRNGEVLGSDVGLALSCAVMLTGMFQWGVRLSAEVESQMTSVERILEYSRLESEFQKSNEKDTKKPDWPSDGKLCFKNVYLYYNYSDPPTLKNVSFVIEAGQKIGIVGRTGAGKSSLLTCLFRLTQPEGTILIDGVDTDSIHLSDLRESISIIPQDPTLFSGTVRENLDPFSNHTDDEIWNALDEVQLKHSVSGMTEGLSSHISDSGSNLSVGQRQLVCLARAILKNSKILVMDEATANVDSRTDNSIQQTIREKFKDCTVLTIAHRLHTILDSDKVLVMESGKIKEFAAPHQLLLDENTMFSYLVRQTGSAIEQNLRKIAENTFYAQNQENERSDLLIQSNCNKEKEHEIEERNLQNLPKEPTIKKEAQKNNGIIENYEINQSKTLKQSKLENHQKDQVVTEENNISNFEISLNTNNDNCNEREITRL